MWDGGEVQHWIKIVCFHSHISVNIYIIYIIIYYSDIQIHCQISFQTILMCDWECRLIFSEIFLDILYPVFLLFLDILIVSCFLREPFKLPKVSLLVDYSLDNGLIYMLVHYSCHVISCHVIHTNHSINQSINQSINHSSINQSISQSIHQSINPSINQ